MSERKFAKNLGKPGTAAQLRETVSQVVKETTVQNKPQLVEPLDFENFILKHKTVLQNDPQRELLIYPHDDITSVVLPRRFRTVNPTTPTDIKDCPLLTKQCIKSYSTSWNLVHYKYNAYSMGYAELPNVQIDNNLKEDLYEIDIDADTADDFKCRVDGITKEGYIMKGPEIGSDRMFVNIGSKTFKRRYCLLRQEIDGTYILVLYKDEKMGEAKVTIVMDFCTDVVRSPKRGNKFCFELRMTAGHKSYVLAAENDLDFKDWLGKLTAVLQQNKIQEEKRAASLERDRSSPPPQIQPYGTLKGLEHSMNPQLIKYSRETDTSIAHARRDGGRSKLFLCYPPITATLRSQQLGLSNTNNGHNNANNSFNNTNNSLNNANNSLNNATSTSNNGITAASIPEPYREVFGHRILLRCERLRFKLQQCMEESNGASNGQQIEPYHTTLCLYDAKNGKKLTENFHFELNEEVARGMIPNSSNDESLNSTGKCDLKLPEKLYEFLAYPKQALLSVFNAHCDIFLVVKIEKVLQGNICTSAEPYVKATRDGKLGVKVQKTVAACCQRLGNYRMPFGWAAKPLFRLYSNDLDTNCEFPAIYRQESNKLTDEELLKLLAEYRKPDKFSKLTVIPGSLQIKIEPVADEIYNSLTSSLAPLKPFPMPPSAVATLEVAEFEGMSEKDVHPYSAYVNHLYVYPNSLNFDTQKMFTRARNIVCVVEVRDSDEEGAKPLQCIYSRPNSSTHHPLTTHTTCAVLHHHTTPLWYEEVKIRLPVALHPAHHLLFTFYHVSCDVAKRREPVEQCVGFAWWPLVMKTGGGGRIAAVDTQQLPVAASLSAGYLGIQPFGLGKGNAGPEITWIDSQKPIFTVSATLLSTVNTRDQHLANLFHLAERLVPQHSLSHNKSSPLTLTLSTPPSEIETCKILKALHAIRLSTLITFLPTLLNELFTLLVTTAANVEIGLNIIRVLINLVTMVCEAGRKEILQSYVRYVFVTPEVQRVGGGNGVNGNGNGNGLVTAHEEMCKHLPNILDPNNTDFLVVNKFMHHADFFFEIVAKSMAQHLLTTGRIKMHRNERFSKDYLQKIASISEILITYILNKYKDMPVETQELNKSLANFLKKCLSLTDRGFIFQLINNYLARFTAGDPRPLHEYKFQFLEIICSHEHYITFNLPISHTRLSQRVTRSSPEIVGEYTLSEDFCRHHFVVALLLRAVRESLNEVSQIRRIALNTLRGLIAKHEFDSRFETKGQMSRIALIYLPWISIVLENSHRLGTEHKQDDISTHSIAHRMSSSSSYLLNKTSSVSDTPKFHRFTMHMDSKDSPMHYRNSSFFEAIAGQAIVNGHSSMSLESDVSTMSGCGGGGGGDNQSHISQETTIIRPDSDDLPSLRNGDSLPLASASRSYHHRRGNSSIAPQQSSHHHRFDKLAQVEAQDMMMIYVFVVKYLGEQQLIAYWQQCVDGDVVKFFAVLEIALDGFRYVGKRNIVIQKTSTTENGVKAKSTKAHTLPARMNPSEMTATTHDNTGTLVIHTRDNRENLVSSENESQKKQQSILEQHLSKEVGLIALDCIGLYCMHFRSNLMASDGDNATMRAIFDIFLTFLKIGQGESLFKHVFAALRSYINNYSTVIFQGNAILCGKLCYELLRLCNSRVPSVRQESCAMLYLLMRSNFEFTGRKGLTRVHLQVIVSVSQMLGNHTVIGLNNARFQESLSMINSYATSDKAMKGTGFPIEVKDLTKRVRTVLMATVQMREHHHDPEMLVDLQHSLANSYASTPELRHTWLDTMTANHVRDENYSEAACCQLHIAALMAQYLKLKHFQSWGAEAFSPLSINIARDETGLRLDTGVQDVQYTDLLLFDQLERCAEYVDRAERYETMGSLYRLIIPILEKRRDYGMLQQAYQRLASNYEKIILANKSGRRMLGRYYRIGFYGQAYFEDDSGVEYIYKEPKLTSLSEISERLNSQYCEKFGAEVVKMIQDSIPVNQSELDQKLAYIQVTHVTPYFEAVDLEERQTHFEQNHDISCFMFETPFTKDGKARGSPEEQCKRRTILTTQYSFPYLKKRIPVTDRRSVELSPIEVAIDEMQIRVAELDDVVFTRPTDVKKLQLRLQGSVCVQVNAGPLAYANAFLDPSQPTIYPEEKVEELKDIYRDFLKVSYSALQVNGKIISSDQIEYQEVLRQNYKKLCNSLSALFNEALWPHEETGSFKRNSTAVFSSISGTSQNSSTA